MFANSATEDHAMVDKPVPWQRTLLVMTIVLGVSSTSVSMSWPFLPLYVSELGIHPIANATLWAGIIMAPQFLLAALVSPFWGALADRVGRKAMVMRSSFALAIFTFLMGFAHNVWQLLALTILYGLFSGGVAAANALVAVSVPEERLGFSLGWLATAWISGTLIGPLIGGAVADLLHHDYRSVYFCTSAGALVCLAVAMLFVREVRPRRREAADAAPVSHLAFFKSIFASRAMAPILLVLLVAQMAAGALAPVVAPYIRSLIGNSPFVGTAAGAAIAVTGLAGVISAPFLGRRGDRSGYRATLLISIVGVTLLTLPQAFARSFWVFIALRSGVGVFLGGIVPSANAWIGRLAPRDQRGRVFGLAASASSLGLFFGPLMGGIVAARFGIPSVFLAISILLAATFVWTIFMTSAEPPETV